MKVVKGGGLILCVFILETVLLSELLFEEAYEGGTLAFFTAIPATILTVYLFRRFAPPKNHD